MTFIQTIMPTPNIWCRPGYCLEYVRKTFGQPPVHPTATAAWNASKTQHRDRNFPVNVWVAVWYGLEGEPAGHVVLRAPDGSCYSTSDLTNTPHHHPDLFDLERYYAYYDMPLTYRGWTEDVQGIPVILDIPDVIDVQGSIDKVQEAVMATLDAEDLKALKTMFTEIAVAERKTIVNEVRFGFKNLGKALNDGVYDLKVWDQKTDNATGDRIINDNRAEEDKTREALKAAHAAAAKDIIK